MSDKGIQTENMLVKLSNLDQLLRLAGEVIIASSNMGLTFRGLQALYDKQEPVNSETLHAINDLAGSTSEISSSLHRLVQDIRTVDLSDLGFRARRLVRDVARKTGKRVIFEFEGEDTTIDKTIVEKLYDPISHQLRNAIDHGIEDSHTREKNGKEPEGRITLTAYNSENQTFIEIRDDGRGVDMEALKQKGIDEGRINPDDPFTEDDALDLMFTAGISTAETVSYVSGRGVGMDVVRDVIGEMGGTVSFKTEKGKGSSFSFRVPLVSAVNIVDALVVRSGVHMFAFPISSVITTMSVPFDEITSTLEKGKMVKHLGHLLPLHDLNRTLDGTVVDHGGETVSVLVIEHKGNTIAFRISEFFSPQKLVIIPLDGTMQVEGLSGTTILGGRKLGFIIDVPSLIDRGMGKKRMRQQTVEKTNGDKKIDMTAADHAKEEGGNGSAAPAGTATAAVESSGPAEPEGEDDTEAAQEFIVEVEKLMPALNHALFALESDPSNSEEMSKAFRLFHTIKGNFIMMGLPKGGETLHSVESVMDRARSRKLDLTPEVMDVLMDGVSYVEEVVRQSVAGKWQDAASSDLVEASARLLPEQRTEQRIATDVASDEVKLSHEASYRMNLYRKQRTNFYRCYIEFESGKQPPFLVACLMYKRFCEVGDVLGTVPKLEEIENGMVEDKLKVLFASSEEADVLEKRLVSILTNHYGATMVKFSRFE